MRFFEGDKQMMNSSSNQMVAIILDVLGILFVVVGGLYEYYHAKSAAGAGLFWLGVVLLIVALVLFLWSSMKKPMMTKAPMMTKT
jgi:drug/metabolite transporter (DMT)-like permease